MNSKLREDMYILMGKLEAIRFPLIWNGDTNQSQGYYDLIDAIYNDYERILERLTGGSDE